MPTGMMIGGVALPLLGGLIGNSAASGDEDKARQLQMQALQGLQNVNVPALQQYLLQQYQSAGQLNPGMQGTVSQDPSLMGGVNADPRLKNAQMQVLQNMMKTGQGGLNMADTAALDQIQRNAAQAGHANDESILQNMQQRGIGGSGAELAARLQNSQSSADRLAQGGLQVGGQAAQRALQALAQGGSLAGQERSQDFGEQAQKASAQDAINRFNSANRQQIISANTQAANNAQAANLQNKQALMNQNTGLANQQQQLNNQVTEQNYENQLRKAQGIYSGQENMANQDMQQAQNTRNMWGGVGQGVGQGMVAGGTMMNNNNNVDKQIAAGNNNWQNFLQYARPQQVRQPGQQNQLPAEAPYTEV